ncbi:hypothetical protein LJC45_01165 [Alistipes sp. OttesenSCG-928-B03]|nr:hypothetical protein [Alistipes sp. OttesenSCG-928-B03]
MKNLFALLAIVTITFSCGKESNGTENGGDNPTPDEVYLTLSGTDIVFDEDGGDKSFTITCNSSWTVSENASWLTPEKTNGNGNGQVKLTAIANDSHDDRNTVVTVNAGTKTETFTVIQKKLNALTLTKDKYAVPIEGGNIIVEVKSNLTYSIVIPEGYQTWIKEISNNSRGLTSNFHTFQIADNLKIPKDRDGYIIVDAGTLKESIYIFQNYENVLILGKDDYVLTAETQAIELNLQTNVDYEVDIPTEITWVAQTMTRTIRHDKLTFNIQENTTPQTRNAEIVIKDRNSELQQTLKITQKPKGVWGGDMRLSTSSDISEFAKGGYATIEGDLTISGDNIYSLKALKDILIEVKGDVNIGAPNLASFDGLYGLERIGGSLVITNAAISSFEGLKNLETIGGNFVLRLLGTGQSKSLSVLPNLTSFKGLDALYYIGGDFIIDADVHHSASTANGTVRVLNSLVSFEGLKRLTRIGGSFIIDAEASAVASYNSGEYKSYAYTLCHLESFKGLDCLEQIGGDFQIKSHATAHGGYNVCSASSLTGMTSFEGLSSLKTIGGNFELSSTVYAYGGNVVTNNRAYSLNKLLSFTGIEGLSSISGNISISGKITKNSSNPGIGESLTVFSSLNGFSNINSVGGEISINDCCALNDYTVLRQFLTSYSGVFTTKGNKYNPTKEQIIAGNGTSN